MKDDQFYNNNEYRPAGYSWTQLKVIANIVFIAIAGLAFYGSMVSHRTGGRIFLVLAGIYLLGILFYMNRSRKNLVRGLVFTGMLFVGMWLYVTYGN